MEMSAVAPEIKSRRESHAGFLERVETEAMRVLGEAGAVGVDEEAAGGQQRNAEPQLAQSGHQVVAPRLELAPAGFEYGQRLRPETGERRALRRCRGRDVEILGELLQVAHVAFRRDEPAQAPAGHVEVLGEAV